MKYKGLKVESLPYMVDAVEICLKAELRRRKDLNYGSPASRYTDKRISALKSALFMARGI